MKHHKRFTKISLPSSGKGVILALIIAAGILAFIPQDDPKTSLSKGSRIVLIGNNLGSRMMHADHFEAALHIRYPDSMLYVRNMCDGGNTAGFRPHSGRNTPWAFPSAEKFQTELA